MALLLNTTTSISFFLFFIAVSHAASTPQEEYWHSVLPNTPIPNAIREILNTGEEDKFHIENAEFAENLDIFKWYFYGLGDKIRYDPSITIFFKEEDLLRPGYKMNLAFPRSNYGVTFLSHQEAELAPFSSSRLPEIVDRFSIDPKSALAKYVARTLTECELPNVEGESKLCATSLESMVDFSTSSLGTNQVQAFSTVVRSEEDKKKPQLFSVVLNGIRRLPGNKLVSCHEEIYPYAVFYCHTSLARGYIVELTDEDGARVAGVAVCHTNTKTWSPDHLAFRIVKVKPGEVPICHFLPQNALIFSRSKTFDHYLGILSSK